MVALLVAGGCLGDGQTACPDGRTPCNGQCVDLFTDPTSCGGCGIRCSEGEFCNVGQCAPNCEDECRTPGERRCSDQLVGAVVTCGDHDGDGCLDWGGNDKCADGETCSNGGCAASCTDECDRAGESVCDEGVDGTRTCGDLDGDGCLEWSAVERCGDGANCEDGACVAGSCVAPGDDCRDFDDCCDEPEQGYHCCPVFHFCVRDFW